MVTNDRVNFYKCSPETYQQYLNENRVLDTSFYRVIDEKNNIEKLYLGKFLLSNEEGGGAIDLTIATIEEIKAIV